MSFISNTSDFLCRVDWCQIGANKQRSTPLQPEACCAVEAYRPLSTSEVIRHWPDQRNSGRLGP